MSRLEPSTASSRIGSIDALRGIALSGIFFVHMIERYLASMPVRGAYGDNSGALNGIIGGIVDALLRSKFFAIFSILFGLSFFIIFSAADRKGVDFRTRFLWRTAILFAVGYAHSLFFRGDILTIYAILAIPLMLLYRAGNRTLLAIAVAFALGLPKYVLFYFLHGQTLIAGAGIDPDTALNTAYYAAVTQGSLLDVFRSNAWDGHLWYLNIQFDIFGRGYQTFCYFLIGMWLGRLGLFERLEEYIPRVRRAFYISLALALPLMVSTFYFAMQLFSDGFVLDSWSKVFTFAGMNLADTAFTIAILCGFLMAYRTVRGQRLLDVLAPYGRMALSNYLLQSLVGTFLFYHWGLGLMQHFDHTQVAGLAIVFIVVQIVLSTLWLRRFNYGPFEWLWRSATYLRAQPMRKGSAAAIAAARNLETLPENQAR